MGIATPRPDGRRLAGGLPHEPGRQQAPDAGRRADPARVPRHRARPRRATAPQPFTGGDPLPSTAWHPEFEDVNNDGLIDLFVSKGNVERSPTTRCGTRATCSWASRTAPSPRAPRHAGIVSFDSRSRRRARRLQPGRAAGPGRGRTSARRCGSGATSAADRRMRRRRWAAGCRCGCASPGGNRDAIGAVIETKVGDAGDTVTRREVVVGGGHIGGQLGWHACRARPGDRGPGPGDVAGRRGRPVDDGRGRPVPGHRRAASTRGRPVDTTAAEEDRAWQRHGSPTVDLPDFGMPAVRPEVPAGRYAERLAALRERAAAAGLDRLVVFADREHSANLAFLTGFDPRFEEAMLIVGAGRRSADPGGQRVLRDGRRRAAADAPRAVPGLQPAQPASRPVPAAARHPGGGGDRPGHAGRRAGLEVVRGSGADRDPGVHRGRAAGPRGRHGLGRATRTGS